MGRRWPCLQLLLSLLLRLLALPLLLLLWLLLMAVVLRRLVVLPLPLPQMLWSMLLLVLLQGVIGLGRQLHGCLERGRTRANAAPSSMRQLPQSVLLSLLPGAMGAAVRALMLLQVGWLRATHWHTARAARCVAHIVNALPLPGRAAGSCVHGIAQRACMLHQRGASHAPSHSEAQSAF